MQDNVGGNRIAGGQASLDGAAGALVSVASATHARVALASAKRIAVLTKFRFMGDTVVATPFIGQLRAHCPAAHIDLLAAPCIVQTFENCPHLDSIIPVDMSGVSRWQHGKDLHNLLKIGNYDIAFVLNRSLHCAVTTALSGIPVRIGYANELRRFLLTVPIPYSFDRNEVDCHLDMLRSIGLSVEHALPDLWITRAEQDAARTVLEKQGWKPGTPVIGLQPGANDPYIREWGAERFASLAVRVAGEIGGAIVIMGGKAEADTASRTDAEIQRLTGKPPINLVGKLGLREALTTIGACDLWIGNDTGLLHCAVAQRVASVGIFGPNKVVRWGYDSPRHRSVVSFPATPAKDDAAVRQCLDAITETDVFETVLAVLNESNRDKVDPVLPQPVVEPVPVRGPYFSSTPVAATTAAAVRRR